MIVIFMMVGGIKTNLRNQSMKIKKIAIAILISIPVMANSGIKVVPLSQMGMSEDYKQNIINEMAEQKRNGFILNKDGEAYKKIATAEKDIERLKSERKRYLKPGTLDTDIQKNISDIKLSFNYKSIQQPGITIIGYAPMGTYIKSGWTGIVEFFKHKDLGTCEYSINDMTLSQGEVIIAKEFVHYYVNHKAGISLIKGSDSTGFMYDLEWDDSKYNYKLECANMKFYKDIMSNMVKLANNIDK